MKNWTALELGWLGVFSAVATGLSLYWGDTWFGFSVFLTGVLSVILCSKGSLWNYAFGTYNVVGYSYVAWANGLFGEVMLNMGYYLPMQLIGFLMWRKHMSEAKQGEVIMKRMAYIQFLWICVASIVGILIYGYLLSLIPSQNTPYIDSITTVLSVTAMLLMVKRYMEQWYLWITVNVFSIIMWSFRLSVGMDGAVAMVVMWTAYLINSFYGLYVWRKETK